MRYIIAICVLLHSIHLVGQDSFTSSNLPIVIVHTNGKTIPDEPKIVANMKIIYNGSGFRNSISDTQYNYDGAVGIELRGNSSLSFDQKQYSFETRDEKGENLDVPLLDMPEENDWVLHAPYNDISLIRNVLAYHLWNEMGHWAPRTRMVELVLNGKYQGVYVLTETIKRDKNRIDIAKLNPADTTGLDLTGGYIMRIDASNSDDDLTFPSKVPGVGTGFNKTVTWLYHYPDPKEIHPKQQEYIRNYIDTVEQLIQSNNFNDPVNGYANYLNVGSFVDYFIHSEVSLNADGYKRSAYFYKDKQAADGTGGKFSAGSVWDYNLAYGDCNFCNGNKVKTWGYKGCETNPTPAMWNRLIEDPTFLNAVECRYLELREDLLSEAYLNSFIDDYAAMLEEAQNRHFTKWDGLLDDGSSSGWMGGGDLWFSAYRVESYAEEIETIKNWLSERLNFLDNNLGGTCLLSNENMSDATGLCVFPNPFSQQIIIESSQPLQAVAIYNETGDKIAEKQIDHLKSIVITELECSPNGLYLLVFLTDNGLRINRKVIKEHAN